MTIPVFLRTDLQVLLNSGSPVLFPTDTLPALAALPNYAFELWKIKNRPMKKPFILMGSSEEELFKYALPIALEDAKEIARIYWPGALTIVLPGVQEIVENLNPFGNSIGMRIPDCPLTIEFLKETGPLATTSANLSGEKPSFDPKEVSMCFSKLPLLGPLPWPKQSGLASTLIEWKEPGVWQLLRKGAVIPRELQ